MLFDLPNDDLLYTALLVRDPAYEGVAFVGVTSTGIFCRLTCPTRKPRRENCVFYASIANCLDAGFSPCKRCRPLTAAKAVESLVSSLLDVLEANPARRWRENDIVARGFDPATVRRAFKRHYGITFLEMARLLRVRNAAATLAAGAAVVDAQFDAGFESSSGFRDAVAGILGRTPSEVREGKGLNAEWLETPLGVMIAVADDRALHLLEFYDRRALPNELKRLQAKRGPIGIGRYAATDQIEAELGGYFSGNFDGFNTPLVQLGSDFTRSVWQALCDIPQGVTKSYSEIARSIGRPTASRAVARANAANQIAIAIPCHRVIGADGSLTGYGGGCWRKQWLLDHERNMLSNLPSTTQELQQ